MERREIAMNWSDVTAFSVYMRSTLCAHSRRYITVLLSDIHLSTESILFQATILFVLMFQNDSLVCFSLER